MRILVCGLVCLLTAACSDDASTTRYGVRGTVDGLDGAIVTLAINGGEPLVVGNGPFEFAAAVVDRTEFTVEVVSSGGNACTVAGGTGTIAGADVEGVVVHCASTDAALLGLSISAAELEPNFTYSTLTYAAGPVLTTGLFSSAMTTVTATASNARATITINGVAVASQAASAPIAVIVGTHPIDVIVTAGDGTTTTRYQIMVTGLTNHYVKASNTRPAHDFGRVVAVSADGTTLAIGAVSDSSGATGINGDQADVTAASSGAVYLYVRNGTTWVQQAYIKPSTTRAAMRFGSALALSSTGDTLVVGATGETSNAPGVGGDQTDASLTDAGAVYVFTRSGGVWAQNEYLKASNPRVNAQFGDAVAISADGTIVGVGSPIESSGIGGGAAVGAELDESAPGAGAVYLFAHGVDGWTQDAYVKASNPRLGANFGRTLAVSGDGATLVVGSPNETSGSVGIGGSQTDTGTIGAGAVYGFTRATQWLQSAYIKASNTRASANFGCSVALSTTTLVVGSCTESSNARGIDGLQADTSMLGAGAAYVFTQTNTVWSQQAYVKPSNTRAGARFGTAATLSADGNSLAIGSPVESSNAKGIDGAEADTSMASAGAAYLFTRVGSAWTQRAYIKSSNTHAAMRFGGSVALGAGVLVVGADGEASATKGVNGDQTSTTAAGAGAAYVY